MFENKRTENTETYTFTYDDDTLLTIHRATMHNAPSVFGKPEKKCACFGCKTFFNSSVLPEDFFAEECEGAPTLLCPECCIDSVLVDGDGYEITEQLVEDMNQRFFGGRSTAR